jgi:hypothetical protein
VVTRVLLLLANLPLAFVFFQGLGIAVIQRVEVVNHSSVPIEDLALVACGLARERVGTLAPGEGHVWRFTPAREGTLEIMGVQAGRPVRGTEVAMFSVFRRIDVLVEIGENG